MRLSHSLPLVFLFFVLVACSSDETINVTTPVTPDLPTGTAIAILPSSSTPSPVQSEPTTVSPTPSPSATATTTPTSSPTNTPTVTPTPTIRFLQTSDSPDGNWQAVVEEGLFQGDEERLRLRITHLTNQTEWMAEDLPAQDDDENLVWPHPFHWSTDGRYFYFTHIGIVDGCYPGGNGLDLYQIDLENGAVRVIVPRRVGYWFAISPDDRSVAVITQDEALIIHDLELEGERKTDVIIETDVEYQEVLLFDLLWSPDSQSLLIFAVFDLCVLPLPTIDFAIIRVEVDTLSQRTILAGNTQGITIVEWVEPEKVLIELEDGAQEWLNPVTGEITRFEE